jgi:ABC-type multidrug transport system permease subunit
MKTFFAAAVGSVPLLTTGVASAQSGYMMNGNMWHGGWMGGYGGAWVPILLVAAVVGLVVWVVKRKSN